MLFVWHLSKFLSPECNLRQTAENRLISLFHPLIHLSCCVGEKADLYSEDDDNLHVCRENIYVYSFVQIIFPLRLSAIEKLANEKLIHELQVFLF